MEYLLESIVVKLAKEVRIPLFLTLRDNEKWCKYMKLRMVLDNKIHTSNFVTWKYKFINYPFNIFNVILFFKWGSTFLDLEF